jgi:dTDP-4-dehydrorhamnose 3,5-epimerase
VRFVNDFDFRGVRRFYTVSNHSPGTVRAWHGHRQEAKFATVLQGAALTCCVRIDDWESPSPELPVDRFVLSAEAPGVLAIPRGYANGFMTLAENTLITFFSTSTLDQSLGDDLRFPARYWDPWSIEER